MDPEKEKEEEEEKEIDVCPVCLKDIADVDVMITDCGHKFHGSCVLNWSKVLWRSNKDYMCPLCRGNIGSDSSDSVFYSTVDFPAITKKILFDFSRLLVSHNVPLGTVGTLDENVLWMLLPSTCQQELVESVEYHFNSDDIGDNGIGNSNGNSGNHGNRERRPYNFSISDLTFPT